MYLCRCTPSHAHLWRKCVVSFGETKTMRRVGTLWKGGRFWLVQEKKLAFVYKTSNLLKSFRRLGTSGKEKRTSKYFKSILFCKRK